MAMIAKRIIAPSTTNLVTSAKPMKARALFMLLFFPQCYSETPAVFDGNLHPNIL